MEDTLRSALNTMVESGSGAEAGAGAGAGLRLPGGSRDLASLELKRIPIQGDASGRRYERLVMPPGSSPETMVLMWLPPNPKQSDEAVSGPVPDKLPFLDVQAVLEAGGLPVPIIYANYSHRDLVILEDLGPETMEKRICVLTGMESGKVNLTSLDRAGLEPVLALYKQAIRLLVQFQVTGTKIKPGTTIAATRAFEYDLLRWELDHFVEYGLLQRPNRTGQTPEPDQETLDALSSIFDHLARKLATLPRELVHRDYQSKNLMVRSTKAGSEELALIDFQDALGGPPVYDLVALLRDSYVVLPWWAVESLISLYLEERAARGLPAYSKEEVTQWFLLQTIQRKLKDAGRFVFIHKVRGNDSFMKYFDDSIIYGAHAAHTSGDPVVRELTGLLAPWLPGFREAAEKDDQGKRKEEGKGKGRAND